MCLYKQMRVRSRFSGRKKGLERDSKKRRERGRKRGKEKGEREGGRKVVRQRGRKVVREVKKLTPTATTPA